MSDIPLSGEVSNSKLAAVFDNESIARAAAKAVADEVRLEAAQVKVITAEDPDTGIRLEPEGRGIWRTILLAHAWLGIAGVVVGLVAFATTMWLDVPAISASPWISFLIFAAFGGIAGLMLGGLVALRPDHDRYVLAARDAAATHRTTVVVHALSADQADHAARVLSGLGADVTRTL
ncbi:hypothetical protein [Arenimonas sp.]|uniref:hypothetical protein n=1 Tax=Arenimonas sp. TaxID=1872635 RepID=UPI0035B4A724